MSHPVYICISLIAGEAPGLCACPTLRLATHPPGLLCFLFVFLCSPVAHLDYQAKVMFATPTMWNLTLQGSKPAPAPMGCATSSRGLNLSEPQSSDLQTGD